MIRICVCKVCHTTVPETGCTLCQDARIEIWSVEGKGYERVYCILGEAGTLDQQVLFYSRDREAAKRELDSLKKDGVTGLTGLKTTLEDLLNSFVESCDPTLPNGDFPIYFVTNVKPEGK